jgi:hypothetical protein
MKTNRSWPATALGLVVLCVLPVLATGQTIDLAAIKPSCTGPFDYNEQTGKCVASPTKLQALDTEAKCKGPGLSFAGTQCTVSVGKEPAPTCGDAIADLAFKDKKCVIDRRVPRSASADYVGDCFELAALPRDDNRIGYPSRTKLKVLSQKSPSSDDRELTVAPASGTGFFSCRAQSDTVATTVSASDLIAIGAKRVGWAYGVLAMPFKYYSNDRSFGSGVSIGPYFGRRWGTPGSAYTFATAATIGTVKGEVRDAAGNITSTPDLQAFSLAAGWMWDISKAQNTKPFKIGMFAGADWVSQDNVVKFKNNRKPWVAFQIGFDFTDN